MTMMAILVHNLVVPNICIQHTDICDHALRALCESRIRKVYLIGRKGPLQVMFSTKEMRTMSKLPGCRFYSDPSHFDQIGTITGNILLDELNKLY